MDPAVADKAGPVLAAVGVSKVFPGVRALADVSFELFPGEILGLVGENGAGKSTLIKILSGAIAPDSGELAVDGQTFSALTPKDVDHLGIRTIYQEFSLAPNLDVAENMFLGHQPRRRGIVDVRRMHDEAERWLERLEIHLGSHRIVGTLSVASQQLVEIARALAGRARVVIMDEPTSALSEAEVAHLFRAVRRMRHQGAGVIFVSHRIREVMQLCDRVVVLRDGHKVLERPRAELTEDDLIQAMVGRKLSLAEWLEHGEIHGSKEIALEVKAFRAPYGKGRVVDIPALSVRRGEVVGLGGLVGAGRTEFVRALFGVDRAVAGEVYVHGRRVRIHSPRDAVRAGIGLVPEDRKAQGLFLQLAVRENVTVARRRDLSVAGPLVFGGIIRRRQESALARRLAADLELRPQNTEIRARNLSGGNQQKVVIARWLAIRPKVLILDEPTRGVDVGAKEEIYGLIRQLVGEGVGMLVISSELPELLRLSDRIVVLSQGRLAGELSRAEATQERIMRLATGASVLAET